MAGLSSGGGGGQKPAASSCRAAPLAPPPLPAAPATAGTGTPRATPLTTVPAPPLLFRRWTPDEDAVLLAHAAIHGTRHWSLLHQSGRLKDRDNKACCNRFRILKKQHRTKVEVGAGADEGSPGTGAGDGMEGYATERAGTGAHAGSGWDGRGAASGPLPHDSAAAPGGEAGTPLSPPFRQALLHPQEQQYQLHQQQHHQQQQDRQQLQQHHHHQEQLQQTLMASWMGSSNCVPVRNQVPRMESDPNSPFGSAAHLMDVHFQTQGASQSPPDASLFKLAAAQAGSWVSPLLAQSSPLSSSSLWGDRQHPMRSHSLDLPPHLGPHPGRTMSLHASAWGNLQQVYSNASLLGRSTVAASLFPPPWGPLAGPHIHSPAPAVGSSSSWLGEGSAGLGMAMPMGSLWSTISGGTSHLEGGFVGVGPSHGGHLGTPRSQSLSPVLIDQSTHSPVGLTRAQELHAPNPHPGAASGVGSRGVQGVGEGDGGVPQHAAPTPAPSSGSIVELKPGTTIVSPSLARSSPRGPPKPSVFRATVGSGAGAALEPAFGQVNASLASSGGKGQHSAREDPEGSGAGQGLFGPVLQRRESDGNGGVGAGLGAPGVSDSQGGPHKDGAPFGVGRCYLSLSESEQGAPASSKRNSPIPPCTDISDGRSSLGYAGRALPSHGTPGSDLGLRLMQTAESMPKGCNASGGVDGRGCSGPRGACEGECLHIPALSHSHSRRDDEGNGNGNGAGSRVDTNQGIAPALFNNELHTQLQALHAADQMPMPSPRTSLGRRGSLAFSSEADDGLQMKRQRMM